jgi:hypothetical protein
MATKLLPFYPHRQNRDGSFDSICLRCFATVANAKNVDELHTYEKDHVCDEAAVAQRSGNRKRQLNAIPASLASDYETRYETRGPMPRSRLLQRW